MGFKNLSVDTPKTLILLVIYFLTARFGLSLDPVNEFATLVWLPSGISLVALLKYGYRLWPGITLGAFLANLATGAPIISALGISLGNTLEAVVAAYLLKKFVRFDARMERLNDVLGLVVFGAFLSTALSATIGIASLYLGRVIDSGALVPTWLAWWIGDMISDLVVAPFIMVWSNIRNFYLPKRKLVEIFGMFILLIADYQIAFRNVLNFPVWNKSSAYMVFPTLILVAFRFGPKGTTLVIFVLSILATFSTISGSGPFVTQTPSLNLLSLQIFMVVTSATAMILAAVIAEKRRLERTKNEFISVASHELKTPITTIKGYSQLLSTYLKQNRSKKGLIYISRVNAQLNNLTRLVSDFFDVSRIESGKLDLQKEIVDINELVKGVIEDMQHLAQKRQIIL